jgi:hypothetical protein
VSTRPVAEKEIPTGWEEINPITIRMAVPGGWIYDVMNGGVVFVPEPERDTREDDADPSSTP